MIRIGSILKCSKNLIKDYSHLKSSCVVMCNQRNFASQVDQPLENRIYFGTLTPQIKAVKIFSLGTSIGGIFAQPILYEQGTKLGGMPMVVFLCTFAGFFTFVTPFLLHWVTRKYVTEMFYDPKKDEYCATIITLFLQKKHTTFKVKDVIVPEVPGMFMSFQVGKQGLFIDPSLFTDPEHYVKIMGYDKPIDFKLELSEKTNDSNISHKNK